MENLRSWHHLFDQLCERAGHHDNAQLASAYCTLIGRAGHDDFETIKKNLRNWRLGRHLPLRRNVALLSRLLAVEDDPELHQRWNALYAAARREAPVETGIPQFNAGDNAVAAVDDARPFTGKFAMRWAGGGMAVLALAGLAIHAFLDHRSNARLPLIGYDARVKLVVGESRLIHGDRGDCDGAPPDWYYTLPRVPSITLGTFSDGGIARKMSNFCNAVVRVRAVRFTATQPGETEIRLLDDFMKIIVSDQGNPRQE